MTQRVTTIKGSSIAPDVVDQTKPIDTNHRITLVCVDRVPTRGHVQEEFKAYTPLVTEGSYCVVFDTIVEDSPKEMFPDRPWGLGDNPKTAVREFLTSRPEFEVDKSIDHKLLISVAPDGFLRRV